MLTSPVAKPHICVLVSAKRGMSTPSSRPRLRAGYMTGEGESHVGKSGVRGMAMIKEALKEKERRENL